MNSAAAPAARRRIVPETAPFTAEQRAWLNGFFAGYLLDGDATRAVAAGRRGADARRRRSAARPTTTTARPGTTRPCRSPSA